MTSWLSVTQSSNNGTRIPPSLSEMSSSRWSQIYNIYADKLLGTNLVDDVVCIQLAGQSVKCIAHTLQGEQKPSQILSIST